MRLPITTAPADLDSALKTEAGRELLAVLTGLPADLVVPLLHYIGYFRPARQQLGFGRVLRLLRQVVGILPEQVDQQLRCLAAIAQELDPHSAAPGWRPLGNHDRLKRCVERLRAGSSSAQSGGGIRASACPSEARADPKVGCTICVHTAQAARDDAAAVDFGGEDDE